MSAMELCVFCGARVGVDPNIVKAVKKFGLMMAERDIGLVYGGGAAGLMGVIADAVLDGGGRVTGIIPDFLAKDEILHRSLNQTIIVSDLFERKAKMIQLSDAFVALPGGMGTFDELLEVFTWQQLDRLDGPVAILNYDNYFDPLVKLLEHAAAAGFYDMSYIDDVMISPQLEIIFDHLQKIRTD